MSSGEVEGPAVASFECLQGGGTFNEKPPALFGALLNLDRMGAYNRIGASNPLTKRCTSNLSQILV